MCYATKTSGAALQDMVQRYAKICEGKEAETECQKLLVRAIGSLEASNAVLLHVHGIVTITVGVLLTAIAALSALAVTRPIALALRVLLARVQPLLRTLTQQQLENRNTILLLEQLPRSN
jgi:hypothetical protein